MMDPDFSALPARIDSRLARRRLYRWLHRHGIAFPPDDDAADWVDAASQPSLVAEASATINALLDQSRQLDADPYTDALILVRRSFGWYGSQERRLPQPRP